MKAQLLATFVATAHASFINNLFARQTATPNNEGYLDSVCSPNGQCAPNNTKPLGYEGMAECLCNAPSTFFADWIGCRQCLEFHGGFSEQELARYSLVIKSVSNAICTGIPTAQFADYFTSINAVVGAVSSGATTTGDQAPSQTAVSLYYTAPDAQGPGAITGSAAPATRSGGAATSVISDTRSLTTGAGSTASSLGNAATGSSGSSASLSSSSGTMPTAGFCMSLALAAAGGVLGL